MQHDVYIIMGRVESNCEPCEAPAGAPPIPKRDAQSGYTTAEDNVLNEIECRIKREEDKIHATQQLLSSLQKPEKDLKRQLRAELEETGMLVDALRQSLQHLKSVG